MRVLLSWLNEFAPVGGDVDALAHELSMLGMAVDGIEPLGAPDEGVIVARVLATRAHPDADKVHAADEAIAALRERGSPSHDGTAARLVSYAASDDGLFLELQPTRWALRLVAGDASDSVASLCVVRD